jgi:hypothetical protein
MSCQDFSYNNLLSNGFTFTLARLPQTAFRVTECQIPSVMVPPPETSWPTGTDYQPGSVTEFEALTLTFIVDEGLKNYEEIFNWITQQRFAEKYQPKNITEESLVSDGILLTMNNNSVPTRSFSFKNLFPVSLGSLNFDTKASEPMPVTCQVEFRFSYFTLKSV